MYVIVHDDLPDTCVFTYEEMVEQLILIPSCLAYEYIMRDGVWILGRRFITIDNREVVYNDSGTWGCLPEYLTYKLPNVCSQCNNDSYMKGNECTFCSTKYGCENCKESARLCKCGFNAFS